KTFPDPAVVGFYKKNMQFRFPSVEVADHRNFFSMRRPYCEIKTSGIRKAQRMCTEFFVGGKQLSFTEKLYIIINKKGIIPNRTGSVDKMMMFVSHERWRKLAMELFE